jgi:WD40 repeat protein
MVTRETTALWKGHRTYVHAVAFTPDGGLLASAGGDLYLRNPASGCAAVARQEGGRPVAGLALSPNRRFLITAGRRLGGANSVLAGEVKFWDTASAAVLLDSSAAQSRRKIEWGILPADEAFGEVALGESLSSRRCGAWSIALAPDGDLLAVGTDNGGVLLWDLPAARLRGQLDTAAAVRSLAFSSDGLLLAAAEASRVQVWNVQTGRHVAVLKGHAKQVLSVAFSPQSGAERGTLLTGSQDETVRVWDVNPARERAVFAWPLDAVRAVAFAPDGMTASAGGDNGNIVVWDCDQD